MDHPETERESMATTRRLRVLGLLLVLALVAGACGGNGDTDTTDSDTYVELAVLLDELGVDAAPTSYPGDPIRITHRAWTPDEAVMLTSQLLDTLYAVALEDLVRVDLWVDDDQSLSWTEFDASTTNSPRGN